MTDRTPRLYSELARWWPLFSPPIHYVEEAADVLPTIMSAPDAPPRTMLELGCGGGSMAFHLKKHLWLTLTDRSPEMLAVSVGSRLGYVQRRADHGAAADRVDERQRM